ncbi:Glutamate-1-semialdehyde 2,1-aminomutase [Serratia rubidaea]|uniref:Glutamate-1-semialdehyde 2,1-aminomutase n=2 Tax=Serratia rubidaea TaxID=61652 RepID=A0A3S5F275_SERRU|nr:Glutamate-1-semialdehyde 2,1-aminomutase [Serratia rubidaea]
MPTMQDWAQRAKQVIAGGTTHDSWAAACPPVFERAEGAYKWDAAGRQYIDFWMGHGALIVGHAHPAVNQALAAQLQRGSHLAGNHTLLVRWAEKVVQLVPSAQQVRFCASGTEATLLAMRLARAYTRRAGMVRIDGHFHGWHDEALAGVFAGWPIGAHPQAAGHLQVVPPYEPEQVEAALAAGEVAAVILEPGGGSGGTLPYDAAYLQRLRDITRRYGVLLIFDEVMSGFRYAPGGVQQLSGVTPDITTLSKVLCGGLPGAAVAGSQDVMACFDRGHADKVLHTGTFNGNPLSAAAGLATLTLAADATLQTTLERNTALFVEAVNARAARAGVDIRLFHQSSIFHILIGALDAGVAIAPSEDAVWITQKNAAQYDALKQHLAQQGIDMHKSHGWLSASHTHTVLEAAAEKFAAAFDRLRNQSGRAAEGVRHD